MITTARIVEMLYKRHPGSDGFRNLDMWTAFDEFKVGTGYSNNSLARLDFWAINHWPSCHNERICYEIKTSRADFLSEMKKPNKRRMGLLYSNKFIFIAPEGVIKREEIPIECGYQVVEEKDGILHAKEIIPAPWRDDGRPSWHFVSAIARRVKKENDKLKEAL